MRLFLDTSVLLASCALAAGASREIFRRASGNGWVLIATPYELEEVLRNLLDLAPSASANWAALRPALLIIVWTMLALDRPAVFPVTTDRPVLFGAFAWADIRGCLNFLTNQMPPVM